MTASAPKEGTANPAPLGLLGFGMTTVLLNLHNAGLFPLSAMIMGMGVFVGGVAQIIAGIMEYKKNNTFGMTAFCSYGVFWLSLVAVWTFPTLGIADAASGFSMGFYLVLWGLFTTGMFFGTLKMTRVHQVVFATLAVLFFLLALAEIHRQLGCEDGRGRGGNHLRPFSLLRRDSPGAERNVRKNRHSHGRPQQIAAAENP